MVQCNLLSQKRIFTFDPILELVECNKSPVTLHEKNNKKSTSTTMQVTAQELFSSVKDKNYSKVQSIIDTCLQHQNNYIESSDDDDQEIEDIFNSFDENNHYTPLHYAVESNDTQMVKLLVPYTIVCSMFDNTGMTCIHIATRNSSLHILKILLDHCPNATLAVNEKCIESPYRGYTPLHFSCYWNTIAREGADDRIQRTDQYYTSMEDIAKFLLESGAYIHALTEDGENALHICARNNTINVAKLLLDRGIKLNQMNRAKITPVMVAATLGHFEFIDLLLENKSVNLQLTDNFGESALHFSLQSQLQRLFKHGIEVTETNERIAYRVAHAGANLSQTNRNGLSALDFISSSLGTILSCVNKNPTAYPAHLEDLLQKDVDSLPSEIKPAVIQHIQERQEANNREKNKAGSCPMVTNNKHLMKKRGDTAEQPDMKELMKSFGHPAHANVDPSSDAAMACPFLAKQKQQQQSQTTSNEQAQTVISAVPVTKGKCPIPFHNELMMLTKSPLLLYVIILIIAVVLARII
jgi:ankyrin repeat protein